jgi:hypothetical protein
MVDSQSPETRLETECPQRSPHSGSAQALTSMVVHSLRHSASVSTIYNTVNYSQYRAVVGMRHMLMLRDVYCSITTCSINLILICMPGCMCRQKVLQCISHPPELRAPPYPLWRREYIRHEAR